MRKEKIPNLPMLLIISEVVFSAIRSWQENYQEFDPAKTIPPAES